VLPAKLPGMREAHVSGKVTANGHVEIGAVLEPDGLPFIKRARVAITYANGAFVVGGFLTLAPTDDYQLELGVEYDITNKQFRIKGLEPKHDDQAKDEPLATVKKDKHFPSIPLFGIGIANIVLTMRLGFGVSINKPFFKFDNPRLIGGLEALDHGQMPAIEFGGRVGIGAEMFVEFGVGIAGQIQLLIASAELGIEGVLRAGLTMNLQSDIHGTFEHGKPLELTIDPSVSAALKLTASLNAFLFAEVLWWTIIDKKWPLASIDLADIPLGEFHPFDPFRLKLGGGRGASIETPSLKDDQSAMTDGAKKAAKTAGDDTAQQETKDKVRPVLARIRQVAKRFESPPDWQGKGMTIAPVEFDSWYGIDQDKWDTYREVADNAEAMVPEEACKTPTEKLSKAVAVLSKLNPFLAGMLVLQWQRAQIAAQGFNPDTGEDVVAKQKELEALVANDYATALIAWQTAVDAQAQAHGKAVEKQGTDFATAEQQHGARTEQLRTGFDAQTRRADRELQAQKDKLAQAQGGMPAPVAPPIPRPVAPPSTKLRKPDPIPQPAALPQPAAPAPVAAVTLPALPADPGASPPAAGRVPPARPPRPVPAPVIAPPSPGPAPSSQAAATGSKSAVSRSGGGGSGAKPIAALPKPTTGAGGTGAPGPAVVAGPQGIIVQDQSLERRRASLGASAPRPGKPTAPTAAPAAAAPTTAASPAAAAPTTAASPAAAAPTATPPGAATAKPASTPDASVQKVIEAGKADEAKQQREADAKAAAYQQKTDAEKQAVAAAEAKAKQAKAAPADEPRRLGPIGERIALDILGEHHTLYIDPTGAPMVASLPTTVDKKLGEPEAAIERTPAIKPLAAASLKQANTTAHRLDSTAAKAADGDPVAADAVSVQEHTLAEPLRTTWAWAKIAADPRVKSDSIDKPLEHPYYPEFRTRVARLASVSHITTVDPTAFAEAIWIKICEAVKAAQPMYTDPVAYQRDKPGRIDMESAPYKQAIAGFEKLTRELAKAATTQFAKARNFGFWSTKEGKTLAEQISDLTLETSAMGTLMDELPTLDANKMGWNPDIWGGLSKGYADAMLPELLRGKKVNICIGAGVTADNVWASVESKTLEKGLRGTEYTLETISKHYAAAATSKANRRELDASKQAEGIKGCLYVGTRARAIEAADAHWATLDVPATKTTPDAPPIAPVAPAVTTGTADTAPINIAEKAAGFTLVDGESHTVFASVVDGQVVVEMASVRGQLDVVLGRLAMVCRKAEQDYGPALAANPAKRDAIQATMRELDDIIQKCGKTYRGEDSIYRQVDNIITPDNEPYLSMTRWARQVEAEHFLASFVANTSVMLQRRIKAGFKTLEGLKFRSGYVNEGGLLLPKYQKDVRRYFYNVKWDDAAKAHKATVLTALVSLAAQNDPEVAAKAPDERRFFFWSEDTTGQSTMAPYAADMRDPEHAPELDHLQPLGERWRATGTPTAGNNTTQANRDADYVLPSNLTVLSAKMNQSKNGETFVPQVGTGFRGPLDPPDPT
jgi:hypothetical protein